MPTPINRQVLKELLAVREKPCISLFQPTHRSFPEREQDPIRFKHLVRQLESQLRERGVEDAPALLAPFLEHVQDPDFWNAVREGLAMFAAPGFFRLYHLPRRVPELAVVNDRMQIKPLLRIVQSCDRYQILELTLDSVRLLEGNRDSLEEVPLAPGVPATLEQALGSELTEKGQSGFPQGFGRASERGDAMQQESGGAGRQGEIARDRERFFREVDRAIHTHHSKPSGLPLLLAALPEHQHVFRRVSHNDQLLAEGIAKDPALLSPGELREESWAIMEQRYLRRLATFVDRFGASRGQGLASDRLEEIGPSIIQGRVATLLVEAERRVPGQADSANGTVAPVDDPGAPVPDLLDELSVWAFEHGGDVVVVPRERMPTPSGVAALYRY